MMLKITTLISVVKLGALLMEIGIQSYFNFFLSNKLSLRISPIVLLEVGGSNPRPYVGKLIVAYWRLAVYSTEP